MPQFQPFAVRCRSSSGRHVRNVGPRCSLVIKPKKPSVDQRTFGCTNEATVKRRSPNSGRPSQRLICG